MTISIETHQQWMSKALDFARQAESLGEVPVGALIVHEDRIVGQGYNRREIDCDPTAHAETIAIREAAKTLGSWRLVDCTLYVTLEPCIQCCGAIVLSRVPRLVYGADDPKAGAVRTLYRLLEDPRLNHRVDWEGGVLAEECGRILTEFFRSLRKPSGP